MITVERQGGVGNDQEEENSEAIRASGAAFVLFGRSEISLEVAAADGIDLFAAQLAQFDNQHFLLKRDLMEENNTKFSS
jgi:hypothetical protein